MSVPALVWVDSIQVGNSTAKSLLRYLATHSFNKPGFFFKNATYMRALEISESTLQRALDHLEKNGFITIERRADEFGRQISNGIYLNIPDSFKDSYEDMINGSNPAMTGGGVKKDGPIKLTTLGASNCGGGPRQIDYPYNSNINNNKINRERERKKRAPHSLFHPNQENILLCKNLSLDLSEEMESFNNRHTGNKNDYEFSRWMKNSKEYKNRHQKQSTPSNEIKSTVPEYGPGHPSWEEARRVEKIMAQERAAYQEKLKGISNDNNKPYGPSVIEAPSTPSANGFKARATQYSDIRGDNMRKVESYLSF